MSSTSNPLPTEFLIEMLSDSAQKMTWCPLMHKPHVLFEKNHIFLGNWYIIKQKLMVYCTC